MFVEQQNVFSASRGTNASGFMELRFQTQQEYDEQTKIQWSTFIVFRRNIIFSQYGAAALPSDYIFAPKL